MGQRATPAFATGAVVVPTALLGAALAVENVQVHTYVHVMAGVLWTGIDLFMTAVLGPVLGGLAVEERASVFRRFTPKMTFLMPTLALVTIVGGITLALRLGYFPNADPWLALTNAAIAVPALLSVGYRFDAFDDRRWQAVVAVATLASPASFAVTLPALAMTRPVIAISLGIVVVLSVLGFGVLIPSEVRMYLEMTSEDPDEELIGETGLRNATLAGIQGLFQLSIVVVMVSMRWGGF